MNINTSTVIESIQQDIQKKIDMEQKRLSDIQDALDHVQQFLLDNGYAEVKKSDDILEEVMKTIKNMKKQNMMDKEDIDNIQKSIQSLKSIKNNIDANIILSLENKIKEIKTSIDATNNKLITINDCLNILLNLQIVCPVCNGNCNMAPTETDEKQRFNKTATTTCTYCDGIGFLSIGKILINEGVMDEDMINGQNSDNNIKKIPTPATEKLQNMQKQTTNNKYVINRQ